MRFAVVSVGLDRRTRRQIPISPRCRGPVPDTRREVIDTEMNELFSECTTPLDVERVYESFWNDLDPRSPTVVKVINVELLA